ncbi:MAG: FkbM family methyltransferase [Bacteroidota bacterium]
MKHQLKIFTKLFLHFGFIGGLKIQLQLIFGHVQKLNLKGYPFPISLRKNTSDILTFYQVFLNNEYDLDFAKSSRVIIDGGANIGLFAIKMKKQFPDSKIICIEPDPDNFDLLKKNLSGYSNIHFENAGIWNKNVKLKVYDKYNCGKWGMVVEEDDIHGNIAAISIPVLMEKHQIKFIDILKLDIETSEKQLFANNYEEWLPSIKHIIIELHDRMETGCAKSFFSAINNCYTNYNYSTLGENVIITNLDLA